jgi:hypothetical protein
MILYCCSDLLWATKVKSTADSLGIPCRPARTLEMLNARLADSPVKALILDLEAGPVAMELLARVRAAAAKPESAIRVVAFGPHVEVGALREAAAAGAESVLTRGAFSARLPEILQDLDRATT